MRRVVCILLLLVSFTSSGQDSAYEEAMTQFQKHFNERAFDSIYNSFAESMKQAISQSTLSYQMETMHKMAGKINGFELLATADRGRKYKVDHEKIVFEYGISLDEEGKIIGLRPQPYVDKNVPVIERNTTKVILPFNGQWNVYWGGTTVDKNYHVASDTQKYAYDILIIKNGSSYKGDPSLNESYYAFGKDIIAPCDGKIVQVITGVPDNVPTEMNPEQVTGNTVVLETVNQEYILFAHLKLGSIVVQEGQLVKQGDLLGHCGNSGNSTEAHLHLSLQNQTNMFGATGGKLLFERILVNGEIKEDYLPERGEAVENIDN